MDTYLPGSKIEAIESCRPRVMMFDQAAIGMQDFWLAGQGGYGIQTSPALSRLAGQLIRQAEPDAALLAIVDALSPNRFS